MRFISMHKANAISEEGIQPPSQKLMEGLGPLMAEMAAIMRGGEGLRPSSKGVRLNFSGQTRTVTPGPFVGRHELIAGYCIVRVPSIDEAIEWASRFAAVVGDVEIDIRPLTEAWDLGFMPKPEGQVMIRYMLTYKADAKSEAGEPPSPAVAAGLASLMTDLKNAGAFVAAEALQPSSKGVRLNFTGGERVMTDGPFIESKELIAGFAIVDVPTIDEAIYWAGRFAELTGDVEIDVRPLYDEPPTA